MSMALTQVTKPGSATPLKVAAQLRSKIKPGGTRVSIVFDDRIVQALGWHGYDEVELTVCGDTVVIRKIAEGKDPLAYINSIKPPKLDPMIEALLLRGRPKAGDCVRELK